MDLVSHNDARAFLTVAQSFLESTDGVTNHHVIQIAHAVGNQSPFFAPPYLFWTVEDPDSGEVTGAAVCANPDGLVLTRAFPEACLEPLLDSAAANDVQPKRLVCDEQSAIKAADVYRSVFGAHIGRAGGWVVASTSSISEASRDSTETVRRGAEDDQSLVVEWASHYERESPSFIDIPTFMRMKLASGELYVLEDDKVRSMATVSGVTGTGARISSVFTPEPYRRNGFAGHLVRTIANDLLMNGRQFVMLTYEKGSPAAKVYEAIGFQAVCYRECLTIRDQGITLAQGQLA
ncbi:MAG: GNAT family N-acetyltransferase [Pseudomonadota bacterium]